MSFRVGDRVETVNLWPKSRYGDKARGTVISLSENKDRYGVTRWVRTRMDRTNEVVAWSNRVVRCLTPLEALAECAE